MAGLVGRGAAGTPKQLPERVGLSQRQARHLNHPRTLEYVLIGCRVHVPVDWCGPSGVCER
jgi:hypothetical protein